MNILSQTRHISSHNIMYQLSDCNKTIHIFHNGHYATNSSDLPRAADFGAAGTRPPGPPPSACVCRTPRKYFPLFPERLIDVYC